MPPRKKRNEFVFVVDLASDEAFIRNTLDQIFTLKALEGRGPKKEGSNDQFKLILMNYPHIDSNGDNYMLINDEPCTMRNDTVFDFLNEHLEIYKQMQNKECTCDWIKAVGYAAGLFNSLKEDPYVQTFFLVVISNFEINIGETNTAWLTYGQLILDLGIAFIAVVDQDVTYNTNEYVENKRDCEALMKLVQIPDINRNIEKVCLIATEGVGILTGTKHFLNFVSVFTKPASKQDWKTCLTLGTYSFPTATRKILDSATNVLSKRLPVKNYAFYKPSTASIDDDSAENSRLGECVPENEVAKVRLFHGHPVNIPDDVRKSFQTKIGATFKILGFIDPKQLPELYYGGGDTLAINAVESSPRSIHFYEFVERVLEAKKYVLVTRVYSANTSASLFVLIPQLEGWFLMANLCNGVRKVLYPTVSKEEVDESKLSAGMLALRRHLVKSRSLFHPMVSLSVYQLSVTDNVRRLVGYNTEFYKQEDIIKKVENIDDVKGLLDTLFVKKIVGKDKDKEKQAGDVNEDNNGVENMEEDEW